MHICLFNTVLGLKSLLSDTVIATPALFWFPFGWNIFPFTFSLVCIVSSEVSLVTCRWVLFFSFFLFLNLLSHSFDF